MITGIIFPSMLSGFLNVGDCSCLTYCREIKKQNLCACANISCIPANFLKDRMLDIGWFIVWFDHEAKTELEYTSKHMGGGRETILTTTIFTQKEIFMQN